MTSGDDTQNPNPALSGENQAVLRLASDDALVMASLAGDGRAFDELVRRYRGAVILTAQQAALGRAQAEEVAQDALLIAYQTLPNLDDPARFGGWLRAIARFRAIRVAERDRRIEPAADETLERISDARESGSDAAAPNNPETRYLQAARNEEIWAALDRLSSDHREALFLHYCEEWPLARIADFLSINENAVKARLFRAREALRRQLASDSQTGENTAAIAPPQKKGNKQNERLEFYGSERPDGNRRSIAGDRGRHNGGAPDSPDAAAALFAGGTVEPHGRFPERGRACCGKL